MVGQHFVGRAKAGRSPISLSELLKHDKVDVNLQDKNGLTAFCWASQNGHTNIIVEIVETRQSGCEFAN
jgi:ankyrin repeat protein